MALLGFPRPWSSPGPGAESRKAVTGEKALHVVDAGASRNALAAHLHGFLSRDGLPPHQLLAIGRAEVERYGGLVVEGRVTGILPGSGSGFLVSLADGRSMSARRVLVATGLRDELPTSQVCVTAGGGISSTAPTAMDTRYGISQSGYWAELRTPFSTLSSFDNGLQTSCCSRTMTLSRRVSVSSCQPVPSALWMAS